MSSINSLPSLALPSIKPSIGEKSIKVNFHTAKLKIYDFFVRLNSFLEKSSLKHIFRSKHFGATYNSGKKEDIPIYAKLKVSPDTMPVISDVSQRYAFGKIENPTLNHNYSGNCHGACLFLASEALKQFSLVEKIEPSQAIEEMSAIAKNFEGGIPYFATTSQAIYTLAFNNKHRRTGNGELFEFLTELFKEYKTIEPKKRSLFWEYRDAILSFEGEPSKFSPFLEGTKKFLEEGGNPATGYCDYMKAFLQAEGIPYSAATHGALREIEIFQTNLQGLESYVQLEADIMSISCAFSGLISEKTSLSNASPREVISQLTHFEPGFYVINLPCFNFIGRYEGSHALAYYKIDDSLSFLYDPNFAIGYEDEEGQQENLVERVLSEYCGPILKENPSTLDKISHVFQRIANFFTFNANSPPFKEIRGLDVYQLKTP